MDYERRVDLCMWTLDRNEEDNDFLNYVLFTDKSTFDNKRLVNRRRNLNCILICLN